MRLIRIMAATAMIMSSAPAGMAAVTPDHSMPLHLVRGGGFGGHGGGFGGHGGGFHGYGGGFHRYGGGFRGGYAPWGYYYGFGGYPYAYSCPYPYAYNYPYCTLPYG